jgi:hypothetical protein
MIQLYIEGKLVDIDEEFEIKLEKDFSNSDEHVVEETEYSFEVELPITKANREAFGFVDVFDTPGKFNKVYNAILNSEEVCILNGKFIMEEINDEYFSGNLYVPAKAKLKDVLGDKKLKDIKAHEMFINSWQDIAAINNGLIKNTSTDRHICYPYILYRLPYNDTGSTYDITTQDLASSGNTFSVDNLFPAYNVLSVLKDCFEGEGYKLQGNIFNQEKFTELYQTFPTGWKNYHDSKNTPYYVNFNCSYSLRKNDNTSSTALIQMLYDDPAMAVGVDALLVSENSSIKEIKDDYNMLVKGKNSSARTLIVPKTGWYRIKCTGNMSFPVNSGAWRQDGRATVDGNYNDSDRVDLSQNIFEFQIKKTDTPMQSCQYYSMNCSVPMVPTNLSKEQIEFIDGLWFFPSIVGLKLSYDDRRNMFAKNEKTAIVRDYSGFDTSEFIAGARLGCPYSSIRYSDDNLEDRRSVELAFSCLPNPAKATKETYTDEGGVEHQYMPLYIQEGLKKDDDSYRSDYGKKTAQVLVREDSYSNFEGYNKFTPNSDTSGGTWDTTSDFQAITYPGLDNSSATATSKTSGEWTINTVVWLEEGDNISFEAVMPYNDYADECGSFEFCDWKHFYNSGINWTNVNFNFEMGIVSTDEKWVPTDNLPVKSFDEIITQKPTNVNQWLGETKVNDYIENFLTTFNLRLTRIGNSTYEINTLANEMSSYGNIINIDEWANVKDAEFSRIDTKTIKLEWTISTDEEGYVHGNNTKTENITKRDESGYTGGITFSNESDTSDSESKTKSNWSYTWMKNINFVNGDVAYMYGTEEVPVIGEAKTWENTYLSISDTDYATDKTPRLIYLNNDTTYGQYKFFNVFKYRNDTTIPEYKAPIIFCRNYITYKNSLGIPTTFRLDYDNSLSTKTDRTITDIFFDIKKGYQYEVDIPVTLPNDIYSKIKSNSLVKFNDGLFKVIGIEGHDAFNKEEATLKLISL